MKRKKEPNWRQKKGKEGDQGNLAGKRIIVNDGVKRLRREIESEKFIIPQSSIIKSSCAGIIGRQDILENITQLMRLMMKQIG